MKQRRECDQRKGERVVEIKEEVCVCEREKV